MKTVNSIAEITDTSYLIKYGQEFCMPCSITEDNLLSIESNHTIPFYSTMNIDEAVNKGFTSLPVIVLNNNNTQYILNDTEIMMDEDDLNVWIKSKVGE
jgi:hypothetical protein